MMKNFLDRWSSFRSPQLGQLERVVVDLEKSSTSSEDLLEDVISFLLGSGQEDVLLKSIETTTHIKWFIGGDSHNGLRVWLHDYAKWRDRATGWGLAHAASVHNHRYDFVSRVLSGGYDELRWPEPSVGAKAETRSYDGGELNVVRSNEVHMLTAVRPGTLTLVVQLPKWSSSSATYSLSGDILANVHQARVPDLEVRLAETVATARNRLQE